MSKSYRVHIHDHGDQGRWLAQQDFAKRPTREQIDAAFPVLAEPGRYEVRVNVVSGEDELAGWAWLQGEYAKDPANPTDAELAATVKRGLADGSMITAEDFLARVADEPAECEHDYSIMLAIPRKLAGAIHGYDDYRECRHCGKRAPAEAVTQPVPKPVDQELFDRTAPAWNCVTSDGPHYTPGTGRCEWCGKSQDQINAEHQARKEAAMSKASTLDTAAEQIADEITRAARGSGTDPVAWVTGNAFMPPLRSFAAAERVWQDSADGEDFDHMAGRVDALLAEREVALECPEYDNALYAVDLRRFEYVDDPGDHETLQQDWQPRQPEHLVQGHEPGTLHDCPACEDRCHCNRGEMECVFDGEHNGLGTPAPAEPAARPAPASGRCSTGAHALKRS